MTPNLRPELGPELGKELGLDTRYAIYFAPIYDQELWQFGSSWLGWDAAIGCPIERPSLSGVTTRQQDELTATAQSYGFHATLKPPFRLKAGMSLEALLKAVSELASATHGFEISGLDIALLHGFLALRPMVPSAELDHLARTCVTGLDDFRSPPTVAELEKRRAAGLTDSQETYLQEWGYPYVMDEFRFHMTLTRRLSDTEQAVLFPQARRLAAPVINRPVQVGEIALFTQPDTGAPFRLLQRLPLG